MRIKADKLVQSIIFTMGFRVIGMMWSTKDLFMDLFLSSLRLVLVQAFDNVNTYFWVIESAYVLINFGVNIYNDVAISRL